MAQPKANAVEQAPAQVVNAVETASVNLLSFQEAVDATIADGGKVTKDIRLTRATYSRREDGHEIVTLTGDTPVERYVADETNPDVFVKSMSKTFVVSLFSLVGMMSNMKDAQVLAGRISKRPMLVESLIPGSVITVVQRDVKADTPFMNYFSNKTNTIEHDSIVTDVVKLEVSDFTRSMMDDYKKMLASALMGDL